MMEMKCSAIWLFIFGTLAVCGWAQQNLLEHDEFEVSVDNDQHHHQNYSGQVLSSLAPHYPVEKNKSSISIIRSKRNQPVDKFGGRGMSKGGRDLTAEERQRQIAIEAQRIARERAEREQRLRAERERVERERQARQRLDARIQRFRTLPDAPWNRNNPPSFDAAERARDRELRNRQNNQRQG